MLLLLCGRLALKAFGTRFDSLLHLSHLYLLGLKLQKGLIFGKVMLYVLELLDKDLRILDVFCINSTMGSTLKLP